jgi:hypothetical protein
MKTLRTMNKLYKYLPSNINCIFGTNNDMHFKKDKIYSLNELLFNSNNYSLEEFNDFVEHNKIKPILRPFEDLTKELPLTKTAAEMIGMKEGDVVLINDYISDRCLFLIDNNMTSSISENELDFLRAMHFNLDFKENEYIKLED